MKFILYSFCFVVIGLHYLSVMCKDNTRNEGVALKKGMFEWPIARKKFWLSSNFGLRKMANGTEKFHYGIDMASAKGVVVKAAADGKITQAEWGAGYGNFIQIMHTDSLHTRYAHLQTILVHPNQVVRKGEIIGTVGDTGFTIKQGSDASHLHFEMIQHGKKVNPLSYLPPLD